MTWLTLDGIYWVCKSCGQPATFKPLNTCEERKHIIYYEKRKLAMKEAYHSA